MFPAFQKTLSYGNIQTWAHIQPHPIPCWLDGLNVITEENHWKKPLKEENHSMWNQKWKLGGESMSKNPTCHLVLRCQGDCVRQRPSRAQSSLADSPLSWEGNATFPHKRVQPAITVNWKQISCTWRFQDGMQSLLIPQTQSWKTLSSYSPLSLGFLICRNIKLTKGSCSKPLGLGLLVLEATES